MKTFIIPLSLLSQMGYWRSLFPKRKEMKVDVLKDIEAIRDCLTDVQFEVNAILPELDKLEELEKERQVVKKASVIEVNLETQATVLDSLLEKYEFFQNDVDINGIRVKEISRNFLKLARKAGLQDLANEKKGKSTWTFNW